MVSFIVFYCNYISVNAVGVTATGGALLRISAETPQLPLEGPPAKHGLSVFRHKYPARKSCLLGLLGYLQYPNALLISRCWPLSNSCCCFKSADSLHIQ